MLPMDSEHTVAEEIARIFASVLGADRVELDDNFFTLRGHSLLAIEVVAQIESRLGVRLPPSVLFERPTPHALAAATLDASGGGRRRRDAISRLVSRVVTR